MTLQTSKPKARRSTNLGAEKLTLAEQRRRFIEAARELGTDNGEALEAAFGTIVPPKLPRNDRPSKMKRVL